MFRRRGRYVDRWDTTLSLFPLWGLLPQILPQTVILLSLEGDILSHFKLFSHPQDQEFDQKGAGKFICRTNACLPSPSKH